MKRTTKKNLIVRTVVLLSMGLLGACATKDPPMGFRNATSQWHAYGSGAERGAFSAGYQFGQSDTVKQMYWAQNTPPSRARGGYDWMGLGENEVTPKEPKLRRKLVNVPVPAHTERDGTLVEGRTVTVEVVE